METLCGREVKAKRGLRRRQREKTIRYAEVGMEESKRGDLEGDRHRNYRKRSVRTALAVASPSHSLLPFLFAASIELMTAGLGRRSYSTAAGRFSNKVMHINGGRCQRWHEMISSKAGFRSPRHSSNTRFNYD